MINQALISLTPFGDKFRLSGRTAQLSFTPFGDKFRLSGRTAQLSFILLAVLSLTSNPALIANCRAHATTEANPAVAEMECRIYLDLNPDDLVLRNKYGMLLLRRNKVAEAEREFTLILRSAPANFDATDSLGLVRLKQQRGPEAIKLFQQAIAINAEDSGVHLHLGQALEATGQLKKAERAYETALQLSRQVAPASARASHHKTEDASIQTALKNLRAKITATSHPQRGKTP